MSLYLYLFSQPKLHSFPGSKPHKTILGCLQMSMLWHTHWSLYTCFNVCLEFPSSPPLTHCIWQISSQLFVSKSSVISFQTLYLFPLYLPRTLIYILCPPMIISFFLLCSFPVGYDILTENRHNVFSFVPKTLISVPSILWVLHTLLTLIWQN